MPVLGADPDAPVAKDWYDRWDDSTSTQKAGWMYNPRLMGIVNYFGYHPRMSMNQKFSEEDKAIVAGWAARKLRSGFKEPQVKKAIDRFFFTYAHEYDRPTMALVSADMQERLFEAEVASYADPILDWIVNGMPDDGPFDDPRGIRSMLLLRCHEGALRYPDVVTAILREYGPSLKVKRYLLDALECIVRWNLGMEDDVAELKHAQRMLKHYELPAELRSARRGNLREASASMTKAIEKMEGKRRVNRTN